MEYKLFHWNFDRNWRRSRQVSKQASKQVSSSREKEGSVKKKKKKETASILSFFFLFSRATLEQGKLSLLLAFGNCEWSFGLSKVGRKAVGDISEQCVTSEERGEIGVGGGEGGNDLWEIGRRWMEVKWPARSVKR